MSQTFNLKITKSVKPPDTFYHVELDGVSHQCFRKLDEAEICYDRLKATLESTGTVYQTLKEETVTYKG